MALRIRETLQPGDVVKLNSGGPKLTVFEVAADHVRCFYYNKVAGTYVSDIQLPFEVLRKVDNSNGGKQQNQ